MNGAAFAGKAKLVISCWLLLRRGLVLALFGLLSVVPSLALRGGMEGRCKGG